MDASHLGRGRVGHLVNFDSVDCTTGLPRRDEIDHCRSAFPDPKQEGGAPM
jgi:hypothetical protein